MSDLSDKLAKYTCVRSYAPPKGRRKHATVYLEPAYVNGACQGFARDMDALYKLMAAEHPVNFIVEESDDVSAMITRNALQYYFGRLKFRVTWSKESLTIQKGSGMHTATVIAVCDNDKQIENNDNE